MKSMVFCLIPRNILKRTYLTATAILREIIILKNNGFITEPKLVYALPYLHFFNLPILFCQMLYQT